MSTKELIYAQIESLDEAGLGELYGVIQEFVAEREYGQGTDILTALSQVQIDGPPDFAENFELYRSGEKRVQDHIH